MQFGNLDYKAATMNQGYPNQGQAPAREDDEPLFTSPPEERQASMARPPQQQAPTSSTFGAPPMGEPSVPSAHPDNVTAATYNAGAPPNSAGAPVGPAGTSLNRSQSSNVERPIGPGMGGGLRRQSSGAYDASSGTQTDRGFFSGSHAQPQQTAAPQAAAPQAGVAGATPVGSKPDSPYVQTQEVPSTGTSKSLQPFCRE